MNRPSQHTALREWRKRVSRQRLDHLVTRDGVYATVTISLPGGKQYRCTQFEPVASVEGIFDDIAGFAGDALDVAKDVATSKVWRVASDGLALVAPALGPAAPAALAASGGMKAATKLAAADKHAKRGNPAAAATLIQSARQDVTPQGAIASSVRALRQQTAPAPGPVYSPPPPPPPPPPSPYAAAAASSMAFPNQRAPQRRVYALLLQPG